MTKRPTEFEKKEFVISAKDAARIIDALEFAASWDKTQIFYELKDWLDGVKKWNQVDD
jgi:hypothetical protein